MLFTLKTNDEDERQIYLTGNFNNWNPKDEQFKLEKKEQFIYTIDIDDEKLPEIIEYKFTKGGWENVEIDKFDKIHPNRQIKKSEKVKKKKA